MDRLATPNVGLPLSQNEYEVKRIQLERQRNKDYNEMLAKV